jgi:peroxisomal membrane protein 4
VGGYVVFGGRSKRTGKISSVNQQIVIYVFARVVLALARQVVKPGATFSVDALATPPDRAAAVSYYAWPAFAAASWAAVMHLFRYHPEDLQPSLRSSMSYIYKESDHWNDLRTFIWHNK